MTVSADDVVPLGFRFDPTDKELVLYYLKKKICNQKIKPDIIAEIDVYKWDPEELPGQSLLKAGDKQWFFFSPRDRKYPNGASSNRATRLGYWKTIGKDCIITYSSLNIGVKKTSVFFRGRASNAERTDWMMHEYTLHEEELKRCQNILDYHALYKVFKKSGPGPKNGEQYGALSREEDWVDDEVDVTKTVDTNSPAMQLNGGIDPADGGRANDQVPCALYDLEENMRQFADDAESQINCGYEFPKVFGQEEAHSSTLLKRASGEVIFPKQDRVCDEPAGVDFPQLSSSNLQLFEAPEVTSAPPQNYEQVLQPCDEGFLEMNDLISPESTVSAVENPVENLQFDELDGMSLFDLNDDTALFPNGMGPIYQDMNVLGNDVLNQVDHQLQSHSLENQVDQQLQLNIVVNQVDHQFQSNALAKLTEQQVKPNFIVNQVQLQPASSNTDLISTQPWMQQQQSNIFTSAESNQGILCQTTSGNKSNVDVGDGTVEEVTQPLAEASENQNGQEGGGDATNWLSSFFWAYVESIPTTSASASEIPLMNPAFEQVSGFSHIRVNAGNTNVAGCNRPVTRRQRGSIGFLVLSILGVLCAILWMLMGTVRVLGRCKFSS